MNTTPWAQVDQCTQERQPAREVQARSTRSPGAARARARYQHRQREYNRGAARARPRRSNIRAAEGYAKQRVNEAEGEVSAFNALLAEYNKAPEVTRRRLYLETMAEVLPKVKNKVIVGDDVKGLLPLLNLNALPGKAP